MRTKKHRLRACLYLCALERLCVRVFSCVYVYVCVCVCVFVFMCVCVHYICVCASLCVCMCMCVELMYVCVRVSVCMYVRVRVHMHAGVGSRMLARISNSCTYMLMHVLTSNTYSMMSERFPLSPARSACLHAFAHMLAIRMRCAPGSKPAHNALGPSSLAIVAMVPNKPLRW
jgi:hypothetical protein